MVDARLFINRIKIYIFLKGLGVYNFQVYRRRRMSSYMSVKFHPYKLPNNVNCCRRRSYKKFLMEVAYFVNSCTSTEVQTDKILTWKHFFIRNTDFLANDARVNYILGRVLHLVGRCRVGLNDKLKEN